MTHVAVEPSLLTNWTFWSFVVSALVAFFSLGPKLYSFIINLKSKPEISLGGMIGFSHVIGVPNCQIFLSISNNNNKNLKVKSIKLEFKGYFGSHTLEAKNYCKDQNPHSAIVLTPFTLKQNQEWSNTTFFLGSMSKNLEIKYRKLLNKIQTLRNEYFSLSNQKDINNSVANTPSPPSTVSSPFIVTSDVHETMMSLYEELNIWKSGSYDIKVHLTTNMGTISSPEYSVLLLENDVETFDIQTENYINGIYINPNSWVWVPIRYKEE